MKLQTGSDHRLAHFHCLDIALFFETTSLHTFLKLRNFRNVLESDSAEDGPDAQHVLALCHRNSSQHELRPAIHPLLRARPSGALERRVYLGGLCGQLS